VFGDIRNPEYVQKTIYQQGELNKDRMYRGMGRDSAPAVQAPSATSGVTTPAMPPASASTTGELERLAELRNRGVLTEDEFQSQKKKILGG
jgi:Short C-terminal domain